MNRTLAAIALAVAAGSVLADDITLDPHTFVSTRSRAEVIAEMTDSRLVPADVQADIDNRGATMTSSVTREQVTLAYLASRDEVAAMNSEDGGSAWRLARAREIVPAPMLAGLGRAE